MSSHDPFGGGDGDRTVLKPVPGGRAPAAPPPRPPAPQAAPLDHGAIDIIGAGSNPLTAGAAPLFALAIQLRGSVSHADVASLQAHVAQEIAKFEAGAKRDGETERDVLAARYAICTVLDEIVMSTPWGTQSVWANQTLLVRMHNEAYGGAKFFQILERLLPDAATNLNLLEFMYVCLAIGFQGQYGLQPNGQADLERIKRNLYDSIRTFRGDTERELAPRWRGVEDKRPRLARYVPLWVVGVVCGGVALLVYVGFLFSLSFATDPVVGDISRLAREAVPFEPRTPPPAPVQTRTLSEVLSSDPALAGAIDRGMLKAEETGDRARLSLRGLFGSGDATVTSEHRDVISRIGFGISEFEGGVQIAGHTDNQPIRTLRFPSNWILSQRRAEAVMALLETVLPASRLSAEGRADTEPLLDNASAENRAQNRRVEVTLFYQAGDI